MASRYLLPITIWFIPAASITLSSLLTVNKKVFLLFSTAIIIFSLRFDLPLYSQPEKAPFPKADVIQYLTEWSAGYGIPETVRFIKEQAANRQIVIATEGYFGTLPDGLLMYFDRSPLIKNIEIFGVGYPTINLNSEVLERLKSGKTVYLLVNEHRFTKIYDDCCTLVSKYERPLGGPALLLLEIKKHE